MDKPLHELKELLTNEVRKVVEKKDISPSELENMYKAVCTMEKICKMEQIEDEMYRRDRSNKKFYMEYDNEMSNRPMRGRDGRFMSSSDYPYHHDPMMMSYEDRRNSDGRSYEHDYSNHSIKDRMIDKFERMMDSADSEYERQEIQNWITKMREEK